MAESRILIVEDDAELRSVIARGLEEEGFTVSTAGTGAEAMRGADRDRPDALIIDIGLPDADGRDLCQALRARGMRAPVLFLTARDAVTDRLSGFRVGGDDYVTKPFHLAEVAERMRALIKRVGEPSSTDHAGLRLDPTTHEITFRGESLALTPTEFRLMAVLADRAGAIAARRELVRAAWPDGAVVHDNTLDVYVARLRRKLGALPEGPKIVTAHGLGYRLR